MNDIVEFKEQRALTPADVRQHVNLIQQVMTAVMKPNTHYGTIPGCKQPSLYKAGSEVLLTTFRIAVDPEIIDLSTPDEVRYQVKAKGVHQPTGIIVGVGIGECSTNEDKYKWRRAICDEEYEATPETRRRIKWGKYQGKTQQTKQIRTEPADLANTVLKMAKKRAQIDLTLTSTGASDIFTQDIEDLPEELQDAPESSRTLPIEPEKKAEFDKLIGQAQSSEGLQQLWKLIAAACKDAGDKAAYDDFKGKVTVRAGELKTAQTVEA